MTEYSGAFVAFDVAKTKHAVAVAEAGRAGEVGSWARSRTRRRGLSGRSGSWPAGMVGCRSASRPAQRVMGCIGRYRSWATIAWSSPRL